MLHQTKTVDSGIAICGLFDESRFDWGICFVQCSLQKELSSLFSLSLRTFNHCLNFVSTLVHIAEHVVLFTAYMHTTQMLVALEVMHADGEVAEKSDLESNIS